MTCQPRDNIFECSTCNRASFVYCKTADVMKWYYSNTAKTTKVFLLLHKKGSFPFFCVICYIVLEQTLLSVLYTKQSLTYARERVRFRHYQNIRERKDSSNRHDEFWPAIFSTQREKRQSREPLLASRTMQHVRQQIQVIFVVVGLLCDCRPVPQIILPLGGKKVAAFLPPSYSAKRGYGLKSHTVVHLPTRRKCATPGVTHWLPR